MDKTRRITLYLVLTAALLLPAGACGAPTFTGYRTYTLEEGVGHMSIEYPSHFNVTLVQLLKEENYTMVDIYGPMDRRVRARTRVWVTVSITQVQDAGAALAASMLVARSLSGYRFIEQEKLVIDGFEAEQVAYFYYAGRTDYETKLLKLSPTPTVARYAFFVNNGVGWTVAMTSYETTADTDAVYFAHLLETLMVLNRPPQ
jgi:hypothetical protein